MTERSEMPPAVSLSVNSRHFRTAERSHRLGKESSRRGCSGREL
jgi:hypothetical protein